MKTAAYPKISNADSMISHPNTMLCNTFVGFISLKYYTNLTETAKMRYAFGCDVGVTGRKLREQRAKVQGGGQDGGLSSRIHLNSSLKSRCFNLEVIKSTPLSYIDDVSART